MASGIPYGVCSAGVSLSFLFHFLNTVFSRGVSKTIILKDNTAGQLFSIAVKGYFLLSAAFLSLL